MCGCPIDWVVCFSRDCERGKVLKKAIKESHHKALDFIGDPRRGVYAGQLPADVAEIMVR